MSAFENELTLLFLGGFGVDFNVLDDHPCDPTMIRMTVTRADPEQPGVKSIMADHADLPMSEANTENLFDVLAGELRQLRHIAEDKPPQLKIVREEGT